MSRFHVLVEYRTRDTYVVEDDAIETAEDAQMAYDDGAAEFLRSGDVYDEVILDIWRVEK